ncbi:MAG: aspartate aminotransferase family protein [Anaerolineales bacterium]|nr:aspartate aminotransferase family protein [Anaerolineales bacterium]
MESISAFSDLKDLKSHTKELGQMAVSHLWHHGTQVAEYADIGPLFLVEGRGSILRDIHGKEYIDGCSRLATGIIGHGRAEMAEAIADQVKRIQYVNCTMGYSNVPATLLAAKLAKICPGELETTYFACSGSEANETAIKMARQAQTKRGFNQRYKVISQSMAYHGTNYASLSACGIPFLAFKAVNSPLVPGFSHIAQPYCYRCDLGLTYPDCGIQCAKMLEYQLMMEGPETVAAFIAAPITVTNMICVPPPEYYPMIREICDRHGVLLIADEVLVGFGRTGKLFASEHWNLEPDIMTMAKGITSGYLPLSGTIASRKIAKLFWGKEADQFMNAGTYSGHPVCCAAALTNIDIIEREGLVSRSAEIGKRLHEGLFELLERPYVGNLSGTGLCAAVELVCDKQTKERLSNEPMAFLRGRMNDLGLLFYQAGNVVKFLPPLVMEPELVDRMLSIFKQSLDEMASRFLND